MLVKCISVKDSLLSVSTALVNMSNIPCIQQGATANPPSRVGAITVRKCFPFLKLIQGFIWGPLTFIQGQLIVFTDPTQRLLPLEASGLIALYSKIHCNSAGKSFPSNSVLCNSPLLSVKLLWHSPCQRTLLGCNVVSTMSRQVGS